MAFAADLPIETVYGLLLSLVAATGIGPAAVLQGGALQLETVAPGVHCLTVRLLRAAAGPETGTASEADGSSPSQGRQAKNGSIAA